jgi:phosphoribulokinase
VKNKMTQDRAELVMKKMAVFDSLTRKSTDQVGWIALQFGVTRKAAARMIDDAVVMTRG